MLKIRPFLLPTLLCLFVGSMYAGDIRPRRPSFRLVKVLSGFVYTEGPAADGNGNLYFTDQRDGPGRIYKWNCNGRLSLLVADADRANGLAIDAGGDIVACQMNGRLVAYDPDGRLTRIVASGYCGSRFNAPNDLVLDGTGGAYFTDPICKLRHPLPPQGRSAVYYVSPCGAVRRLIDNLWFPNGILLSRDQRTLYVIQSGSRNVMAYPVLAPGVLGKGCVFCRLGQSACPFFPGGDGGAIDAYGNVYITSQRGVQIFDAAGNPLGIVNVPQRPANLTFGGHDGRTMFVTAGGAVYVWRMQ